MEIFTAEAAEHAEGGNDETESGRRGDGESGRKKSNQNKNGGLALQV